MKISIRYQKALEMYLEWAKVSTPMAGSWSDVAAGLPNATDELDPPGGEGVSAAEWLFMYESRGTNIGKCGEPNLLARYWRGKMMRDWWTKQKGWWDKNAIYMPEEWLRWLGPLPFIDLFDRAPISRLVRYYYDNHYQTWEFRLDGWALEKQNKWGMWYYERDERHNALRNVWRMIRIKWIDPTIDAQTAKGRI